MIKKLIIKSIKFYQKTFSPDHGLGFLLGNARCRFYPSCSDYALDALSKYGTMRSFFLILKRLFKCHPFHSGGYDPLN